MNPYQKYKPSGVEWIGEIPGHWGVNRIKYVATIETGTTPPKEKEEYYEGGTYLWVKPDELNGLTPILDSKEKLTEAGRTVARVVPEGSVLVCCIGTIGKIGVAGCDLSTNQQINAVVFDRAKVITPAFGKYVLSSLEQEHIRISNRVVVGIINKNSQKGIAIPIPPLPEQQTTAAYLNDKTGKIDALIKKKERLIELLKEQRTAIINQAVTKGINPDVKMKESGIEWIGDIPEHWNRTKIRYEVMAGRMQHQDGNHGELHPTSADYVDDGIPFIMANNINDGEVDIRDCKFITKILADTLRVGFAKEGDVLLTHKGTIGRVGVIRRIPTDYLMLTPQVTYYRCSNRILNDFLRYVFESHYFQTELDIIASKGTTRDYVGLMAQNDLNLVLPRRDEQEQIVKVIERRVLPTLETIRKNERLIQFLNEYRTAVISEVVTGKIDVGG